MWHSNSQQEARTNAIFEALDRGIQAFALIFAPEGDDPVTGEVNASSEGSLTMELGDFSESEMSAAQYLKDLGNDVLLRKPVGTRAGGATSDLVVNGVNYDVYTPTTNKVDNIVGAIAKKNSQTVGIVLDLSKTQVKASQLTNLLQRVQGAGATNIKRIIIMPK